MRGSRSSSGPVRDRPAVAAFVEGADFAPATTDAQDLRVLLAGDADRPVEGRFVVLSGLPDGESALEVFSRVSSWGVTGVLLVTTGWSLTWRLPPGAVAAVRDHINVVGVTPLVGVTDGGPRFVHVDGVYRKDLRIRAAAVARKFGWDLRDGVYARTAEPLPPTSAEGRWLRALGVDLVGGQVVPQSIIAAREGLGVLALVVVLGWAGVTGSTDVRDEGAKRSRDLLTELLPALSNPAH